VNNGGDWKEREKKMEIQTKGRRTAESDVLFVFTRI